jgi:hypothetical protein
MAINQMLASIVMPIIEQYLTLFDSPALCAHLTQSIMDFGSTQSGDIKARNSNFFGSEITSDQPNATTRLIFKPAL